MRLLLVIFSILFYMNLVGQASDSTVANTDSIIASPQQSLKSISKPFGFRLVWDYGKTALLWTDFETKTEVGVETLLFEKIQFIGEYGFAELNPPDAYQNGTYQSNGSYYRVGIGYLTNVDQRNKIGIGFRYAQASFDDNATFIIGSDSDLNEAFEEGFSRRDLIATWYEIVLTSEKYLLLNKNNQESSLNNLISIGFLFRYRIMSAYDRFAPLDVYAVPGYGRTLNKRVPALNLILKINLL